MGGTKRDCPLAPPRLSSLLPLSLSGYIGLLASSVALAGPIDPLMAREARGYLPKHAGVLSTWQVPTYGCGRLAFQSPSSKGAASRPLASSLALFPLSPREKSHRT